MALTPIKLQVSYGREYVHFGYFGGYLIRQDKLRILNVYDGANNQTAGTWQGVIPVGDRPPSDVSQASLVWATYEGGIGTREITIKTNGDISLDNDVFRGGFIVTWVVA